MKTLVKVFLLLVICANQAIAAGDLIVKGNLGVGTLAPDAKLDVKGGVKIGGADAVCAATTEGMVRYNGTEKRAEFCDGNGWMLVLNGAPVDITGRADDYPLKAGEVVYLNYTNATSVPLHVATVEGEYEVDINGNVAKANSNNYSAHLNPNNTIYPNFIEVMQIGSNDDHAYFAAGAWVNSWATDSFTISDGNILKANLQISTITVGKAILCSAISKWNSTYQQRFQNGFWNDSTTPWTSLGTVVFPFAQSGKIIIRRKL